MNTFKLIGGPLDGQQVPLPENPPSWQIVKRIEGSTLHLVEVRGISIPLDQYLASPTYAPAAGSLVCEVPVGIMVTQAIEKRQVRLYLDTQSPLPSFPGRLLRYVQERPGAFRFLPPK